MFDLDHDLQIGRIPFFFHDRERLVVADLTGRNRARVARACRRHTVDRPGTECFFVYVRAIPELELVELPYSDICCGSAGVYNITQTEASLELLAEKMKHAASTRATTIVTANPGCLLQMRAGAELHRTGQQVLHVLELLDRALE